MDGATSAAVKPPHLIMKKLFALNRHHKQSASHLLQYFRNHLKCLLTKPITDSGCRFTYRFSSVDSSETVAYNMFCTTVSPPPIARKIGPSHIQRTENVSLNHKIMAIHMWLSRMPLTARPKTGLRPIL